MESDNSPNTFQPDIKINPSPPQRKNNLLQFIIVVLLLAVLGVGIFIAVQLLSSGQNNKPANKVNKQNSNNQGDTLVKNQPQSKQEEQKKVAYINGKQLQAINSDGTGKIPLYPSGGGGSGSYNSDLYFPGIAWKNSNELSFINCASKGCALSTVDVTNPIKITDEINSSDLEDKTQIMALTWNHVGDQLAYVYKLPDGQMRMDFKSGVVKNVVKTFASLTAGQGGRGGSLDDNVSIYFSPDDKYVLVTNTLGQPTVNDKSTIWVFDSSGKEVLNIKSNTNTWATQATWDGSTFIYKQGNNLYRRNFPINDQISHIGVWPNFHNPVIFWQGQEYMIYWVESDNSNTLPHVDLVQGSEFEKKVKLAEGYYKPIPLDEAHIIALKAQKVPEGQEAMFSYVSGGLSKIDLRDKKVIDLVSGDINLFAVSP